MKLKGKSAVDLKPLVSDQDRILVQSQQWTFVRVVLTSGLLSLNSLIFASAIEFLEQSESGRNQAEPVFKLN